MKVKSESEVAQSCQTPSDPMDCSLSGSSVHGIFQARVLEWGAIAFSGSHPESLLNIFCGTYTPFSQSCFSFPLVLGSWALVREDRIENGILPHLELKTLHQAYCSY